MIEKGGIGNKRMVDSRTPEGCGPAGALFVFAAKVFKPQMTQMTRIRNNLIRLICVICVICG